jgi:hypothetical protein
VAGVGVFGNPGRSRSELVRKKATDDEAAATTLWVDYKYDVRGNLIEKVYDADGGGAG